MDHVKLHSINTELPSINDTPTLTKYAINKSMHRYAILISNYLAYIWAITKELVFHIFFTTNEFIFENLFILHCKEK